MWNYFLPWYFFCKGYTEMSFIDEIELCCMYCQYSYLSFLEDKDEVCVSSKKWFLCKDIHHQWVSEKSVFVSQLFSLFLKITELLNDVERLKQALHGLSQLTHMSGSPTKRQSQLIDSLQHQVKSLQRQLAVSKQRGGAALGRSC